MLKVYSLLAAIIISFSAVAQAITEYRPVKYSGDSIFLDEKKFKKGLNMDNFSTLPKAAIDNARNIYYNRYKNYLDNIKDHEYIIDPKMTAYLEATFKSVLKGAGVTAPDSFKFLLTRSPVVNAYSDGDWNIYLNIGLLEKMENESQLAFIFCHEIAHQQLCHTYKHIYSTLKWAYSKELSNEIKELKKDNDLDKLIALNKKYVYRFEAHNREDEKSADSLGMLMLMKTDFDARQAIRALQILDSVEGDSFNVDFKKHFDNEGFRFKDSWLAKSKTLTFGGHAVYEFEEDSLKTHPDCPLREKNLQGMLEGYNPAGKTLNRQNPNKLAELRTMSAFEEVQYMFDIKRYAKCLYFAMHLADRYPTNAFAVNTAVKCLGEMIDDSKKHILYQHVVKAAPNFVENYNQLLRMIDRITLNDLTEVSINYANNNAAAFGVNENFNKLIKQYHFSHQH